MNATLGAQTMPAAGVRAGDVRIQKVSTKGGLTQVGWETFPLRTTDSQTVKSKKMEVT